MKALSPGYFDHNKIACPACGKDLHSKAETHLHKLIHRFIQPKGTDKRVAKRIREQK